MQHISDAFLSGSPGKREGGGNEIFKEKEKNP